MTHFFIDEIFSDKNLSEASKKLYKNNLMKLNDNQPIEDFNFLKDTTKIQEKISKYGLTTQRSFIIAVICVIKTEPELYKVYFDLLTQMNGKLKQQKFKDNFIIN